MRITLNGEPYEVGPGTTLAELLRRLDLREDQVALEHNLAVVRRTDLGGRVLREGDRVEIVHFVGGG